MWDAKFDRQVGEFIAEGLQLTFVERTKWRPIAAGNVSRLGALTFLGAQLSVGLAILTQLNWYS
jgi:4-hydroxybenzoate polyprenyltransferase